MAWKKVGLAAAGLLAAELVYENCGMLAVRQDTVIQPAYTGRQLKLALVSDTHSSLSHEGWLCILPT